MKQQSSSPAGDVDLFDDVTCGNLLTDCSFLDTARVPVQTILPADSTVAPNNADKTVPADSMVPVGNIVSNPPSSIMDLPAELRIEIYDLAFKGSRVTVRIEDHNHRRKKAAAGKPEVASIVHSIQSTKHYALLLTCRKVYEDALLTYWDSCIVTCKGRIGPCYLDEFIQVIPPAMLTNAKHLRNINLPHRTAARIQGQPDLAVQALLDKFTNLESCEIVIAKGDKKGRMWSRPFGVGCFRRNSMRCTSAEEHVLHGKFITRKGKMPSKWLQETYGISEDTEIQFLSRQSHYMTLPYSPEGCERELAQALVYLDYTRATFCAIRLSDCPYSNSEVGYRCAMKIQDKQGGDLGNDSIRVA